MTGNIVGVKSVGSKLKFILSDLHLGAGFPGANGNPLEDFTADDQFTAFLQQIVAESERDRREVELIINGDMFEFLQVPATDHFDPAAVYPTELYLDSTETASLKRLNLIIKGHPHIFNALSDFMHISEPQRRITIIKGNHDVNLYWPRVKGRLRETMGASGSRSSLLLFAEEFVSREKIYVEHGHQRAEKMNSYHDFLDPRHPNRFTRLYYPAGSYYLINHLNKIEPEYPFVDGIKPITALIWCALAHNFDLAARLLSAFIHHTTALVVSNFTPGEDIALPTQTLLSNLENPDQCRRLAQQYAANPDFRLTFHRQIQQYLADASIANKAGAISMPAEVHVDPLVMAHMEQTQQQAALRLAAQEIAWQERAAIIVFGHSHHPAYEKLDNGHVYINTGCWVGKQVFEKIAPDNCRGAGDHTPPATISAVTLPYARIEYNDHGQPTAQLLDFANNNQPI